MSLDDETAERIAREHSDAAWVAPAEAIALVRAGYAAAERQTSGFAERERLADEAWESWTGNHRSDPRLAFRAGFHMGASR